MIQRNKRSIFAPITVFDGEGTGNPPDPNAGGGGGGGQAALDEARVQALITQALSGAEKKTTKAITDAVGGLQTQVTTQFSEITNILKGFAPKPGDGTGGDKKDGQNPELTAKVIEYERNQRQLQEQLQQLQVENKKAKEDAERAERHARIRSALGAYQFLNEDAGETAFNLMERDIRRDADTGNLVGGPDGALLPYDVFIKEMLNGKHSYLLNARPVAGSGATRGGDRMSHQSGMMGTTEMIKPNMRAEERAAVIAAIQQAGSQIGQR
jgi:hypothetical protein